jgi:hypothetical protein
MDIARTSSMACLLLSESYGNSIRSQVTGLTLGIRSLADDSGDGYAHPHMRLLASLPDVTRGALLQALGPGPGYDVRMYTFGALCDTLAKGATGGVLADISGEVSRYFESLCRNCSALCKALRDASTPCSSAWDLSSSDACFLCRCSSVGIIGSAVRLAA